MHYFYIDNNNFIFDYFTLLYWQLTAVSDKASMLQHHFSDRLWPDKSIKLSEYTYDEVTHMYTVTMCASTVLSIYSYVRDADYLLYYIDTIHRDAK